MMAFGDGTGISQTIFVFKGLLCIFVFLCYFRLLWFYVVSSVGFCFFQYRANRLAEKNVY